MHADFSKILNQAFKITFKNKWLWIFGLVLAALSSGGSNFSSFDSLGGESDKPSKIEKPKPALSDRRLQAPISPPYIDPDPNYIKPINIPMYPVEPPVENPTIQWFSSLSNFIKSIPVLFFVALSVFLLILIAFGIAIGLYATSWASSSLIYGINQEDLGITGSLAEYSKKGRRRIVFG